MLLVSPENYYYITLSFFYTYILLWKVNCGSILIEVAIKFVCFILIIVFHTFVLYIIYVYFPYIYLRYQNILGDIFSQ